MYDHLDITACEDALVAINARLTELNAAAKSAEFGELMTEVEVVAISVTGLRVDGEIYDVDLPMYKAIVNRTDQITTHSGMCSGKLVNGKFMFSTGLDPDHPYRFRYEVLNYNGKVSYSAMPCDNSMVEDVYLSSKKSKTYLPQELVQ